MGTSCPECDGVDLRPDLIDGRVEIVCNDCGAVIRDTPTTDQRSESSNEVVSGSPVLDCASSSLASPDKGVEPEDNKGLDRERSWYGSSFPDPLNNSGTSRISVCKLCNGSNFILEVVDDVDQYVCQDCGFFVEEQLLVSGGDYAPIPGKGEVVYGWTRAPKPKHARDTDRQYVPKGKISAIQTTRDVCSQLKMRSELEEQAVALFERMYAEDQVAFLKTAHKDTMGACCAYVVARQNDIHVTIKTLKTIHPMKVRFLSRCIKLIREVTRKPLQPQTLESLVSHVLQVNGLAFGSTFEEKVCTLVTVSQQGFLAQGRDYTNVIVTIAYLVWISEDVNSRKSTTFSTFCENFRIRRTRNAQSLVFMTKKLLATLANQLPWLKKKVPPHRAVFYIADILKYNRSVLSRAVKQDKTDEISGTESFQRLSSDTEDASYNPPLAPPSMKNRSSYNSLHIPRSDHVLPDNVNRSDLDKEDLGPTEFDDEVSSYILSSEEVQLKRELLQL